MNKKLIRFLGLLIIPLAIGFFIPTSVNGAASSNPVFSVKNATGLPGGSVQIPLVLTSSGQVSGLEFVLKYDPALLQYQSTVGGELSSGFSVFANPQSGAGSDGVKVIIVDFSGRKIPTGSGTIAIVNFAVVKTAVAGQTGPLALSGVVLSNDEGEAISGVEVSDGNFLVNTAANGTTGGSGNSGGDDLDASITAVNPALQPAASPAAESPFHFSDLMVSHWAAANIYQLCQIGVVSGYPDGSFRTGDYVSRAEFIKMMVVVLNLKTEAPAQPSFADVNKHSWYYGYVEAAAKAGMVNGAGKNFLPDAKISRQEIAIILVRALGSSSSLVNMSANISSGFADDQSIAPWAKGYVAIAVQNDLISGYPEDHTFRSERFATRAESCVMISRFRSEKAAK